MKNLPKAFYSLLKRERKEEKKKKRRKEETEKERKRKNRERCTIWVNGKIVSVNNNVRKQ